MCSSQSVRAVLQSPRTICACRSASQRLQGRKLVQGGISSLTLDAVTAFAAYTREHDILPRIAVSVPGGETRVWNMTIPSISSVKVRGGLCWDDYE